MFQPVPAKLLVAVLKVAVAVQIGPDEIARLHVTSLANLLVDVLCRYGTAKLIKTVGGVYGYFTISEDEKNMELKTY